MRANQAPKETPHQCGKCPARGEGQAPQPTGVTGAQTWGDSSSTQGLQAKSRGGNACKLETRALICRGGDDGNQGPSPELICEFIPFHDQWTKATLLCLQPGREE